MAKSFKDNEKDWNRLMRVCRVVRNGLGLQNITGEYAINPHPSAYADCLIPLHGWRLRIDFHPLFWKESLDHQIDIVIHEHIHAAMIPLSQFIFKEIHRQGRKKKGQLSKAERIKVTDAHRAADEIAVDHLVSPIRRLLDKEINAVL